jgi:GNAT superfamily N-acetyltransferase
MFQDMAELPQQLFEVLRKKSEVWTADALRRGEYVGWLVAPAANSNRIVGGGGVQLRHVAPHPNRSSGGQTVASGKHGIIINVFTESEWRRRGVARLVMHEIVRWARVAKLDRLVLHASADGRTLYELTGFVATNEMRLRDDLLNGAVEDVCHTPTVSADVGETIGHSRS